VLVRRLVGPDAAPSAQDALGT